MLRAWIKTRGDSLLAIYRLWFVEVGTVTAKAPGKPKARLFRFPKHEAIVNRMGFNNEGASHMAQRLRATRKQWNSPAAVGVNLGKSKVTPLDKAVEDYVEIHVSW